MKTLLVFTIVICVVSVSCSTISADMRLENNVFFTYGGIKTLFVCGMLCLQSSRCEAINFRSENNTCFFVDQRLNSTVVPDTGYVYSDIGNWNTAIAGFCETKPCDSNSFCVPGTSNYFCVTAAWAQ